jgi:hypothetical protein
MKVLTGSPATLQTSPDVHVEVEVSRKTVKFVGPLQVFFKSPRFGLFPLYTSFYLEKTDVFN